MDRSKYVGCLLPYVPTIRRIGIAGREAWGLNADSLFALQTREIWRLCGIYLGVSKLVGNLMHRAEDLQVLQVLSDHSSAEYVPNSNAASY